jgi:hypothetical protein
VARRDTDRKLSQKRYSKLCEETVIKFKKDLLIKHWCEILISTEVNDFEEQQVLEDKEGFVSAHWDVQQQPREKIKDMTKRRFVYVAGREGRSGEAVFAQVIHRFKKECFSPKHINFFYFFFSLAIVLLKNGVFCILWRSRRARSSIGWDAWFSSMSGSIPLQFTNFYCKTSLLK